MDAAKRKALEVAGYRIMDAEDFVGFTPEERELFDLRYRLAKAVRARREGSNLTQGQLARRLGTTQPRVARIEAANPEVSLDQIVRGFFAVGGRAADLLKGLEAASEPKETDRTGAKRAPKAVSVKVVAARRARSKPSAAE